MAGVVVKAAAFTSVKGPGRLLHLRVFMGGTHKPKSQQSGVEDLTKLVIVGATFHPEQLDAGVPMLRALMEALRLWQETCVADNYDPKLSLLALRANTKGTASGLLLKARGDLVTAVSLLLSRFAPEATIRELKAKLYDQKMQLSIL